MGTNGYIERQKPYPKRIKTLIKDYQEFRRPEDFHNILRLIDKLLIKIIQQIYKMSTYSYLRMSEPNEIYHTAIIALNKVILNIKIDDKFTIKKLSSYLSGYIAREFQMTFSSSSMYVGIESDSVFENLVSSSNESRLSIESVIDGIRMLRPDYPEEAVVALKQNLIDGKSLQKVADDMRVKKGCIRSWVNRGKVILRKMIERERKQDLWLS